MALIKYSIGGPITTIKDEESTEKREENLTQNAMAEQPSYIIVCKQCHIQHMILQGEASRACFCGNIIKLADLS